MDFGRNQALEPNTGIFKPFYHFGSKRVGYVRWCKQDQILKTKTKVTRPRPRSLLTRPRPRPKPRPKLQDQDQDHLK